MEWGEENKESAAVGPWNYFRSKITTTKTFVRCKINRQGEKKYNKKRKKLATQK